MSLIINETAARRVFAQERLPLFVTRFSLSSRTAIGVQTRRLLSSFASIRHLYWEDVDMRTDRRSTRLETPVISRIGAFKRTGAAKSFVTRTGLSAWKSDDPKPYLQRRILSLKHETSVVYLAPISESDARRMLQIINLLERPFVLHLWDILDGLGNSGSAINELIVRAEKVLCLSIDMAEAIPRDDAELLIFSREDTELRARAPSNDKRIVISLLGDIVSYSRGLEEVVQADRLLSESGLRVEWQYVGNKRLLRRIPNEARTLFTATGFLENPRERDKALSHSHFAFLPGPQENPEDNHRSRFSIPSRVLDFCAVGLPLIGLINPRSATARFIGNLAAEACLGDGAHIATKVRELTEEDRWVKASKSSRSLFECASAMDPANKLRRVLESFEDPS